MTDNEIKKALECCLVEPKTIFLRDNKTGEITTLNMNDIFNLITRQQAIVEKFEKVEHFADKTIATLQAENERLEVENQSLRGAANSLKMNYKEAQAEIERLQNAYNQVAWERDIFAEDMKEEIKKDCSYLMLDIKTIKSEAVKEFAERVKEKIYTAHFGRGKNEFFVTTINPDDLDNLIKEMVGENNG